MFSINFRIVIHDYDEVPGESGFFQINCGELSHGEFYSPDVEMYMSTEWLMNWFESLAHVCSVLLERPYVAFCDYELVDTWLEFSRVGDRVYLNVAHMGQQIRELWLYEKISIDKQRDYPKEEFCNFEQMKAATVNSITQYIEELYRINPQLESEEQCIAEADRHFYRRIQALLAAIDIMKQRPTSSMLEM